MKTPVNLADKGVKDFADIAVEVLDSNLSSIAGSPLKINMVYACECAPSDFLESYPSGVGLFASEAKSGYAAGLIFNVEDITTIADLMLMGDGEAKSELDDDTKDAVAEIANQFFGGLTVPVETKIGKKVQLRSDNIKSVSLDDFKNESYICVDMHGELKSSQFQLSLFMDDDFGKVFADEEPEQITTIDTSDFFGADEDIDTSAPLPNITTGGHANMDMLLDIEIPVSVRMGSAKLFLKDILGLGPGNIVELDQNADELIELTVNNKLVARGEVVIVDGYFGFRIKEIISKAERLKKLKD